MPHSYLIRNVPRQVSGWLKVPIAGVGWFIEFKDLYLITYEVHSYFNVKTKVATHSFICITSDVDPD